MKQFMFLIILLVSLLEQTRCASKFEVLQSNKVILIEPTDFAMTFDDAKNKCASLHATLAVLNDVTIFNYVMEMQRTLTIGKKKNSIS